MPSGWCQGLKHRQPDQSIQSQLVPINASCMYYIPPELSPLELEYEYIESKRWIRSCRRNKRSSIRIPKLVGWCLLPDPVLLYSYHQPMVPQCHPPVKIPQDPVASLDLHFVLPSAVIVTHLFWVSGSWIVESNRALFSATESTYENGPCLTQSLQKVPRCYPSSKKWIDNLVKSLRTPINS